MEANNKDVFVKATPRLKRIRSEVLGISPKIYHRLIRGESVTIKRDVYNKKYFEIVTRKVKNGN